MLPCGSRNALILNRLWTIVRRLSLTAEALGATAKARCGCGAGTVLLWWHSHVDHATHWFGAPYERNTEAFGDGSHLHDSFPERATHSITASYGE